MVKLTASQKKKLKLHAVNQTASHMKKMVKLMREGDSFNEAHKEASKPSCGGDKSVLNRSVESKC